MPLFCDLCSNKYRDTGPEKHLALLMVPAFAGLLALATLLLWLEIDWIGPS
jgi:hypothetical protein